MTKYTPRPIRTPTNLNLTAPKEKVTVRKNKKCFVLLANLQKKGFPGISLHSLWYPGRNEIRFPMFVKERLFHDEPTTTTTTRTKQKFNSIFNSLPTRFLSYERWPVECFVSSFCINFSPKLRKRIFKKLTNIQYSYLFKKDCFKFLVAFSLVQYSTLHFALSQNLI